MSQVHELAAQIEKLDPSSRDELLSILSAGHATGSVQRSPRAISVGTYPSVVSTPGVCGGAARLVRTRIPIWVLERMRQLGVSEGDILRSYPMLGAADLAQAWMYATEHREEVDQAIRENEEE